MSPPGREASTSLHKPSDSDKHEAYISTTQFGFKWGPVEVRRLASFPRTGGGKCIVMGLYVGEGDKREQKLEIYVSPSGRSVRCWRDGRELR